MKVKTDDALGLKNATAGMIVLAGDGAPSVGTTPTVSMRPTWLTVGTNPPPTPPSVQACVAGDSFPGGWQPEVLTVTVQGVADCAAGASPVNGVWNVSRLNSFRWRGIFGDVTVNVHISTSVNVSAVLWAATSASEGHTAGGNIDMDDADGTDFTAEGDNQEDCGTPGRTSGGSVIIRGVCAQS